MSAPVQIERCPVGTKVESRKYKGSVCDENGRRWERGTVVGHDPDLDLPVVRWEGGLTEAVERGEYELARRSKCCGFPVTVESGDEGTSNYVCGGCGEACDVGA